MTEFLLALTIVAIFVLIIRSSLRPGKKQLAERRTFIQRATALAGGGINREVAHPSSGHDRGNRLDFIGKCRSRRDQRIRGSRG
jgi:hypothetical protein